MTNDEYAQPIVDTDIWVFLIQSGYEERLIKHYGFLFVSDIVEKEILKWNKNQDESKFIALKFQDYRNDEKIQVIQMDSFDEFEQKIINHQLQDYGLQHVGVMEKNKGEFVSLIYALHKNLKKFKTNDRNFLDEIEEAVKKEITISNWNDLLDKYSSNPKEKSEAIKVTQNKQVKMKEQNKTSTDPRWDALKALVG